jgi:hypothetical protein
MSAARIWPFLGLALLLVGAAHLVDVTTREALVRRFLADDGAAMVKIIENYGLNTRDCHFDATNDVQALAAALFTAEMLATPRITGWVRRTVVHIARFAGAVPDMSIGPGRIKLTAARSALQASKSKSMRALSGHSDTELAQELLESCTSAQVITAILDSISREGSAVYDRVDRKFVRKAAALYNGQLDTRNRVEAKLSHEIYLQLVYDAYQHYRFLELTTR